MSKITNGSMKLIKSEITDIIYSTIGTDLPSNFDKIDAGVDAVNTRVNNIITTPVDGVSAQEIIDARNGEATLGTRLNNMQTQTDTLQDEVDALITTGVPKLVSFDYDISATTDNQTVFTIPYEYLSLDTDTVEIFVNGIAVPDTYYIITEPVEVDGVITLGYVTLNEAKPSGTIVKVRILKNVPNGDEGSVDGAMITVDSIPLNRINSTELDGFMTDSLSNINTSLNAKANKNNAEFTGTMILNTKDVATYEKFEPTFLNGWQNATDNVWQPLTFYKIGNICFIVGILESSSLLTDGRQSPICINTKFIPKNHFISIVNVDNEWHDFIYDKTGNMYVTGQIPANKRVHFSFCIGEVN